jgi:hypothetical protein
MKILKPKQYYLKQKKYLFLKNREQEGKIGSVWGWYQRDGEEHKERVQEGECNGNIMY